MYLTTIAGGSGDTYQDVQGRTLILTGNDRLWSGRQVWTDGHYIFSFAQQADTPPNKPVISENNLIFPYLVSNSGQYKFFTKDFLIRELAKGYGDGIFVAGRKNSYLIADSVIYDFGNGRKFSSSYNKYKARDACVDADGNLIRLIEDNSNTGDYYALVYKNNDLIKKHTFQITQYSWVVWQFAKVRPDCSFYGLFYTYETPYTPWTETPKSTSGIYRQYKMNYQLVGAIDNIPQYHVTYTYSDSSASATILHYESDAQVYKEIAFYYDSKQGRKDVWVQTTTGGNVQSQDYIKDNQGLVQDPYKFEPPFMKFSDEAGFREGGADGYPKGLEYEVPTNTGIPIVTGNRPSPPYYYNGRFEMDTRYMDNCLSENTTITNLVVYVGEPVLHPKTVNTVSQPFDFPTSDNNATEPMHCHISGYFSVDWNCLGLHREHSGDFIRDALKIGGKTYFKMHYSSLYDSSGKIVVEMDSNNFRIKATGMGEILHKNISKIK